MICVSIKGPSYEEAGQQMREAARVADLIELRLDLFSHIEKLEIKKLMSRFPKIPIIFTIRSQIHGGNYTENETHRLDEIRSLAELKPPFIDIENHVSSDFIKELSNNHPEIKVILSYHNFAKTPDDFDEIFQNMKSISANFYKIAVKANSIIDAIKLLNWSKGINEKGNRVIVVSMGPFGEMTRILAGFMGSPWTYASVSEDLETASGQIPAKILVERYRYPQINKNTALFGLIGDPVDRSISDKTHNHFFASHGLDAVYIKMQVKPNELGDFLHYAKRIPFQGLSATMPLKEVILKHLDEINESAQKIGAVNTLKLVNGKYIGFNTDGFGALNALEQVIRVREKKLIILGAGGAARAIAYEAHQRGAKVIVLNRSPEKAEQIAKDFGCQGESLDAMQKYAKSGYDILINCTPVSMPILKEYIRSDAVVMDIKTRPKETEFLRYALEKGCRVVYGYRMFVEQAIGQYNYWFDKQVNAELSRRALDEKAEVLATI